MDEKARAQLAKLVSPIEKCTGELQKLLDQAAEISGVAGIKMVAENFRNSAGEWSANRIRGLADPKPTATPEGLARREKALAEAKKALTEAEKGGDQSKKRIAQARVTDLEWQLGVLRGELPADTPRPEARQAQNTGEEG